jgi:hypothetical protein
MSTRCVTPFYKKMELVKGVDTGYIPFPCGKCPPCIRRRVSGWAFRLNKQSEQSNSAHFVTLTYNDEYLNNAEDIIYDEEGNIKEVKKRCITENGLQTLVKADLQKFFKRLRKLTKEKISYYAVGEYGSDGQRPHYHIILFNANPKIVENAWSINDVSIGNIHFGDVGEASVGYTLKYISKEKKIPMFQGDDRQKEFALMSKGLGKGYLTEQMVKWHKRNIENRVYLPLKDGKKAAMPRYYKDKLYDKGQKFRIGVFMRATAEELEEALENEHGDNLERVKVEQVINDFRRMYKKAEKRQKPLKQNKLKVKL